MAKQYKTSCKVYSAWNYGKEIEDLNAASEQGWQLIKGGCFHSRFVKDPDVRFRYQLDYGKIEDLSRYIETFREQGWEYINSTFNGWHYFRKRYDPSQPEEAYEIFTDRESLQEMNGRWARLALVFSLVLFGFAVLTAVQLFRQQTLPTLVRLVLHLAECAFLLYGYFIMRNPESNRSRRRDGVFLTVFFAVLITGLVSYFVLSDLRPSFSTEQQADSVDEPITDNRWMDFDVKYPDNYYFDLQMDAPAPVTFSILSADGTAVFSETGTSTDLENVRLRLPKGRYELSMSCESGFRLRFSLE